MDEKDIQIRETTDADFSDIMEVEKDAFGYDKEANLVEQLLSDKSAEPIVSLLAFNQGKAIGHVLFTRVLIGEEMSSPLAHILAPLAVKPEFQKQGIGGLLIAEGIKRLKAIGSEMLFVLGHPEYYPRFGFKRDAELLGFPAPYPIPSEDAGAWMVMALAEKGLSKYFGKIRCADKLDKPEHWKE